MDGSGVWGLSAVGHKKRAADRDRDEKVRKGHKVDDDGGARQRQIEWEGFLAYAENKERELYKILCRDGQERRYAARRPRDPHGTRSSGS